MALLIHNGRSIPLDPDGSGVGREAGARTQIVIPHDSVSRLHAVFAFDTSSECWTVCDQGSTNGTFIGTERCVPHHPREIRDVAQIRLGEVAVQFRLAPAPPVHIEERRPPSSSPESRRLDDIRQRLDFIIRHARGLGEEAHELEQIRLRLNRVAVSSDAETLRALVLELTGENGELTELSDEISRSLANFLKLVEGG